MTEIGYIPNETDEIQTAFSCFGGDPYRETIRYDHSLPLRGVWIKGEFSLVNFEEAIITVKGGERLKRKRVEQL